MSDHQSEFLALAEMILSRGKHPASQACVRECEHTHTQYIVHVHFHSWTPSIWFESFEKSCRLLSLLNEAEKQWQLPASKLICSRSFCSDLRERKMGSRWKDTDRAKKTKREMMDAEISDTQKNIWWNEKALHTHSPPLHQNQNQYSLWFPQVYAKPH